MMTSVLLADPDLAVRSAITLLLKHKLGIRSIDEAIDASQLAERVAQTYPDLLLIDWEMPGLNVADIMNQIRSRGKRPSIIMMSVKDENEPSALSSGADDFLNKRAPAEQVLNLLQKHLQD